MTISGAYFGDTFKQSLVEIIRRTYAEPAPALECVRRCACVCSSVYEFQGGTVCFAADRSKHLRMTADDNEAGRRFRVAFVIVWLLWLCVFLISDFASLPFGSLRVRGDGKVFLENSIESDSGSQ